jgi:hypothetical protein
LGVRDDAVRSLESIADYQSLIKLYVNSTGISKEIAEKISNRFPNLSVVF